MGVFKAALTRLVLAAMGISSSSALGAIGFDESQTDRIRIWNDDYYEIAINKTNGQVISIQDKTTGQQVSPGNVYGPWVLKFSDGTWLDGDYYSPSNSSRQFSYTWNAQDSELTLSYIATGSFASNVTLTIQFTEGPEIDTSLRLLNLSSFEVELLAYPVHLAVLRSEIEGIYLPYQEGIRLNSSFLPTYEFGNRYPGQMFADFAFTELTSGNFAIFGIQDPADAIQPAWWRILNDSYAGGVGKYHHDFTLAVRTGRSWTSPTMVFSIGAPLDEVMDSYWTRNQFDQIPTLLEKLGPTLFDKLAGAVLLKRDFFQGSWNFNSFLNFLPNIPTGNLLHLVAFWDNGFDENYPDYLPPHPALGSLTDMQNLVATARAEGHLVMPYTNPTWWDDASPTLASLGTGIVAVNRSGNLVYENYGVHGGYVVSPYSSAVIARQDQTRDEFTLTVPCDLLFEDQVGARQAPEIDENPAARSSTLYTQGLVEVAERSSQWLPIMSEGGFDRITWYETGFCNSQTVGWQTWPDSTFDPFPMTPLWAHENLVFYSHNLAGPTMANDLPSMTYYTSLGYSLSYNLQFGDFDWLDVLDCFQKQLIAGLIGQAMTDFELLSTSGHTRASYADGTTVTANLTATSRGVDDHIIAPDGFIAQQNGDVLGGVLTTMHGQLLSGSSPHYLALDHDPYRIAIYQPRGDDTNITLPRPADWFEQDRILLVGVTKAGDRVDRSIIVFADKVIYFHLEAITGQPVDHFEVIYCRMGDSDCDGDIDDDDRFAFEDCFSGPGGVINPTPPRTVQECLDTFDFDGDFDTDVDDFTAFQNAFDGSL